MSKLSDDYDRDYRDSPSHVKMKFLTEKISFFQHGMESESQIRTDNFTSRIRQIEEKVTKLQISEEAKLNVIPN